MTAETWARGEISWRLNQGERTAEDFDSAERTESSAEDSAPAFSIPHRTTWATRSNHVDKTTCLRRAQSTTPVLMADRYVTVPHADSMDSPGQPTHEQNVPKCLRWYTVQQTRGLLFPRYFKWYTVQQTRGLLFPDISNGILFNRLEVYYPIPVSSLSLYLFISCEDHATSHQNSKLQTLSMTLNSLKTIHST